MKKLVILLLTVGVIACGETKNETVTPQSLSEKVEFFLDNDQYADALTLLDSQDESAEVLKLQEKTHLNYGLYLEYRDSDVTNMRDKMNGALEQYIKVLRINPKNEKAETEIQQILGIYSTFPDRSPDAEVVEELRELGFDI